MQRPVVTALLAVASLVCAAGCSSGGGGAGSPDRSSAAAESAPSASASATEQAPPAKGSVKVLRTVTKDLKSPWGLAPLPQDGLLVSSRDDGTITRIDEKTGGKTVVGSVPGVSAAGEGGLLGIALSPSYASDHMVYAYFTTESDNRVVRMVYDEKKPKGQQLGAPDTLLRGIPKGTIHNGGRLAFGPDRMLYVTTGEAGEGEQAQDKKKLGGKILRMTPDGDPAPGNPFGDSAYVYSYGHRNVQGLAWDDHKNLWASEFGQDTWDELNLIKPGDNYGWPIVEGKKKRPGFHDPVVQWRTSEASPSGIAYTRGSVWLAALRGERLWRVPLRGTRVSADPQAFLQGKYGRLRTVVPAGTGKLWLLTNETDSRGTPEKGDDRLLEIQVS